MSGPSADIAALLEELRSEGTEEGVQVCCYLDSKPVIDTWAGVADRESGRRVDGDSVFTIFSATKGVSATCLHILADRSQIDYDQPVVSFWPEFGAEAKDRVTVRDIMTHRAGIPYLPDGVTPEQLCDWPYMTAAFAAMKPAWEPGTQAGYHSRNYNWLAGEIVRRVDGRDIGSFLLDEVCRPLGIDGLFLGIPDEVQARVAPVIASDGEDSPTGAGIDRATLSNLPCVRRSQWRGMGNARSLARLYAMLANGGILDGVRILSADRVAVATALQFDGEDVILRRRIRRGLVYQLGIAGIETAFGHSGGGVTLAFADPEARFSFAYTKNLHAAPLSPARKLLNGDPSAATIVVRRCRELLGLL